MSHQNSSKWYRPQELAEKLSRTVEEAMLIVKSYGCKLKVVNKEIWVSCEEVIQRANPFAKKE